MKPNASTAALPKKNDGTLSRHKGTEYHRYIQYSAMKSASFATIDNLRQTEMQQARALFLSNADASYTRAGRALNPASGRTVEVVKLKPRSMTVTEQSLFDRVGCGAL